MELALCQCGQLSERILAFRDSEASVFVAKVRTHGVSQRIAKIGRPIHSRVSRTLNKLSTDSESKASTWGSSVEQLHFNDLTNMLVGIGDGRISERCQPRSSIYSMPPQPFSIFSRLASSWNRLHRPLAAAEVCHREADNRSGEISRFAKVRWLIAFCTPTCSEKRFIHNPGH